MTRGNQGLTIPDSVRLQQVSWNLLNNAVQFTPRTGRVALRSCNDEQGNCVIEISDTGIGIEPEQRQPLKGVALSGFGMEEDLRIGKEAGFDYHLTKPVEFQKLEGVLREIGP